MMYKRIFIVFTVLINSIVAMEGGVEEVVAPRCPTGATVCRCRERQSGIRSRESGTGNRESGIKSQESRTVAVVGRSDEPWLSSEVDSRLRKNNKENGSLYVMTRNEALKPSHETKNHLAKSLSPLVKLPKDENHNVVQGPHAIQLRTTVIPAQPDAIHSQSVPERYIFRTSSSETTTLNVMLLSILPSVHKRAVVNPADPDHQSNLARAKIIYIGAKISTLREVNDDQKEDDQEEDDQEDDDEACGDDSFASKESWIKQFLATAGAVNVDRQIYEVV